MPTKECLKHNVILNLSLIKKRKGRKDRYMHTSSVLYISQYQYFYDIVVLTEAFIKEPPGKIWSKFSSRV